MPTPHRDHPHAGQPSDHPAAAHPDALSLYYSARDAAEQGRPELALQLLEQSWNLAAHSATAFFCSRTLQQLGRHAEALQWALRAHQLNPTHNQVAVHYARVLLANHQPAPARELATLVLTRAPTYGPARQLLQDLDQPPGPPPHTPSPPSPTLGS